MEKQCNNPFSLKGKTILITGASSGIGRRIAIDVSNAGGKVVLVGRDISRLKETLSFLVGKGHTFYTFDLKDLDRIKAFVSGLIEENGAFDGFVHSAGVEKTVPLRYTRITDYEELFRVNCLSSLEIVKHLNSGNGFSEGGSVILISSISALIGRKGLSAYSASKGALISASRVMALELAKKRIRVNTISPGTILTPMVQDALNELPLEIREQRLSGFPLGLGDVSDVSNACVFLLSEAARWITGHNLVVDGGYTSA